jgi:hypothetical protein
MATTATVSGDSCTTPCGSAASAARASRPPSRPASRTPTHRKTSSRILRGCVVSAGAATTSYMRGSVLSPRAATVVDLPEACMSDREGRGGSIRRLHYRASCPSNDPRTEAQWSASTAKATRRRSRSAFRVPAELVDPLGSEPRVGFAPIRRRGSDIRPGVPGRAQLSLPRASVMPARRCRRNEAVGH